SRACTRGPARAWPAALHWWRSYRWKNEASMTHAAMPSQVTVYEVGPRDGLQNAEPAVDAGVKVRFVEALADAGLPAVEAGAFVSAKSVPQMADTEAVYARLRRRPGTRYPALVPNERGLSAAQAAGVTEIAVFTAASETFNQRNIHASIAESIERFRPV